MPEIELVAMHRHMAECERCARHDTIVRRGLLLVRNLPPIQPSADFGSRLNAKLREIEIQLRQADTRAVLHLGPGLGTFACAAAGVIMVGLLAVTMLNWNEPREFSLAPVVAMKPELPVTPFANRAFVALASSGVPMWPAAMFASPAPAEFLAGELDR